MNRYFDGSPIYPAHFTQDFNRSYMLEPSGTPVGAVVLLHGLTDSPYSQRHIARFYQDHGFVAIVIRLPGHGTVPAGLVDAEWEDWTAATRLAVREARRRVGPSAPLHLVGFSNGGALAVKYALDAIADPQLTRADRIVLISPMIGITRFARFAGLASVPALFPAFAKAAWLGVVPEFNPFKYNSFPVNGAVQSFRLTQVLQRQIAAYSRSGQLAELPPIITFQSVMDFTVSTSAIITALYSHLPANGSELVLFDVNRTVNLGALLRPAADTALATAVAQQSAELPNHDHYQRRCPQRRRSRAQYCGRRRGRSRSPVGRCLSGRPFFTLSRRVAVSDERFAVRVDTRFGRRFRNSPRFAGTTRRAQRPDREPGFFATRLVQSVLPLHDRADRRRHRRSQPDGQESGCAFLAATRRREGR